jgi:hypothetical protein
MALQRISCALAMTLVSDWMSIKLTFTESRFDSGSQQANEGARVPDGDYHSDDWRDGTTPLL